ncbi:MAG: hypothetical protein IBX68_11150 [Dehalococcoidia bacterium]|nr:hypothetical protein [Dehalococcoidia bacterium]
MKAVIAGMILLLVIALYGASCTTDSAAGSTYSQLEEQLRQLQAAHEARSAEVTSLETSLADTVRELSLKEQERLTMSGRIASLETENQRLTDLLSSSQGLNQQVEDRIEQLESELHELQAKLDLYHETGIFVYSGVKPPYLKDPGVHMSPENNPGSTNVDLDTLKAFILNDRTDSICYTHGQYTCGNFAEDLHNNAEAAGIRAAIVAIRFADGSVPHALNAFVTTAPGTLQTGYGVTMQVPQGIVFIDSTGATCDKPRPANNDGIAQLEIGQPYTVSPLVYDPLWRWLPLGTVSRIEIYW